MGGRKALAILALTVAAGLAVTTTLHAEVQLKIQDGRVSLVAKDATLRQILAEWSKVGQTKIVNGERVPGGPLSLQLTDVPEKEALDILFRTLSGYMAAPRAARAAGLSRFDRIVVMPTVASPPSPASRAIGSATPPVFQPTSNPTIIRPPLAPPVAAPSQLPDDEQDEDLPPPGAPPTFTPYPPPQVVNPGGLSPAQGPLVLPPAGTQPAVAPPSTYPTPNVPVGVAVPGMVVPVPQQLGRPAQPGQTPQ